MSKPFPRLKINVSPINGRNIKARNPFGLPVNVAIIFNFDHLEIFKKFFGPKSAATLFSKKIVNDP